MQYNNGSRKNRRPVTGWGTDSKSDFTTFHDCLPQEHRLLTRQLPLRFVPTFVSYYTPLTLSMLVPHAGFILSETTTKTPPPLPVVAQVTERASERRPLRCEYTTGRNFLGKLCWKDRQYSVSPTEYITGQSSLQAT